MADMAQFKIDYTFWMNIFFALVAISLIFLHRAHMREHAEESPEMEENGGGIKRIIVYFFVTLILIGLTAFIFTAGL